MKEESKHIPKGLNGQELLDHLEATADYCRAGDYTRELTPHEISAKQAEYSEAAVNIFHADKKLEAAKLQHKQETKAVKEEMKDILKTIRTKQDETTGDLFVFKDYEDGRLYEYTEYGQCVTDRRMTPEERQTMLPLGAKKPETRSKAS